MVAQTSVAQPTILYIPVAVDMFGLGDFVDEGHFNAPGALKFAEAIATEVAPRPVPDLPRTLS